MKKILCLIIAVLTLSVQTMPAFAEDTVYDFSDEAQEEFNRQEAAEKAKIQKETAIEIKTGPKLEKSKVKERAKGVYQPQEVLHPEPVDRTISGTVLLVPKGEEFEAQIQSSINSESLSENDIIAAVLSKDWVYKGRIIAPQGSVVYGKATDVKKAGYAYANGKLALTFDEVLTPSGDRIRLTSTKVYINVEGNRFLKTARNVAVGAVAGVAVAALATVMSSGNVASGIAIGAAVGGSVGLMSAVGSKGEGAEVPAGSVVMVRLIEPVEVVPYE